MAFHLFANMVVAILFGSFWSEHGSNHPIIEPINLNTPTRYYASREAADYSEADVICKQNFGDNYGLAALVTKDDQTALETFLLRNGTPNTDFWIGSSYYEGAEKFVWTNLSGADGKPLPLADFAIKLIVGYPSKYNNNDRTVFFVKDKWTSGIKIETVTATRRFICEYRQDRVVPTLRG